MPFKHGYAYKHGHATKGALTPEYQSWIGMRQRCLDENAANYPRYGGRGIKICDRWLGENGFVNFLTDMGPRPQGMTLHRIDNDGDYCPENCIWADGKTQASNKRHGKNADVTFFGKTQTKTMWAREFGLKYATFRRRLDSGWTAEEMSIPLIAPQDKNHFGVGRKVALV